MTLEEKQELIKSATTEEELEARMAEIEANEEEAEKPFEENAENDNEEVKEKINDGEIRPEEERGLLKDTNTLEKRSVEITNQIERKGEFKMEKELRNSKEYINAYAEYIKTGDEKELRALITTDGYATGNSATVEVPDMVYDIVKTAWEREDLMRRVRTISVKGNLKVQFEVSGDAAVVHQEGNSAVSEESLVLGVVTLTPVSIKKWISLSDEVVDLCDELTYQFDGFAYELKNCVRGSFTDSSTPDELANYLENLKAEIESVVNQLREM